MLSDPSAGPFTVFAPVSTSLADIPARETILAKAATDPSTLAPLILFHVARGAGPWGSRIFTPSLANASECHRNILAGERFVSGIELQTLLADWDGSYEGMGTERAGRQEWPRAGGGGGAEGWPWASTGEKVGGASRAGFQVFLGPASSCDTGGGRDGGRAGLRLMLGAFSTRVVVPDLNAVNGVVHGISGVLTYPGYKRPRIDEG
ncbi:unnamed protein product [Discosporangium mesarthrocarpum]